MKAEIDIALMQYLQDKRTHEEVITYLIGEFEKQSNQKVIEELERFGSFQYEGDQTRSFVSKKKIQARINELKQEI
jgi:hypothetical protein